MDTDMKTMYLTSMSHINQFILLQEHILPNHYFQVFILLFEKYFSVGFFPEMNLSCNQHSAKLSLFRGLKQILLNKY